MKNSKNDFIQGPVKFDGLLIAGIIFVMVLFFSCDPKCNLGGGSSHGNGPGPKKDSVVIVTDTLPKLPVMQIEIDDFPITKEDIQFADQELQMVAAKGGKKGKPVPPPVIPPVPTGIDPRAPGVGGGCIYIEWNGCEVNDPNWNGGQRLTCAASKLDETSRASCMIFGQEQYAPYNVVFTDNKTWYDTTTRAKIKVVITSTSAWANMGGSTGVTYVASLYYSNTVAFVFEDKCLYRPDFISYIMAHESGHAVGLHHQSDCNGSTLLNGYSNGKTMGVPWQSRGWFVGINQYCQPQDDPKILATNLTLR